MIKESTQKLQVPTKAKSLTAGRPEPDGCQGDGGTRVWNAKGLKVGWNKLSPEQEVRVDMNT